MNPIILFPAQLLSFSRKNMKWRKECVDFVDLKLRIDYNPIRNNLKRKRINYDLVNGILHMDDVIHLINPYDIKAKFIPDNILHYSIINSKLNVLRGEELDRAFDFRVVVTNPNAISEIEKSKEQEVLAYLKQAIEDQSASDEDFLKNIEKISHYFTYEWQDTREIRGNELLNHYAKEYNTKVMFNNGFMDALNVGEEIYQCDIVGGEPVIERIDPMKIRVYKSGYSNKIEDADIIVLEDYWSPGRIYDTYGDVLTKKDFKYLEESIDNLTNGVVDSMDNYDERLGFVNVNRLSDNLPGSELFFDPLGEYSGGIYNDSIPIDSNGNFRVMRVYWKSRKKIKKIKFYNPEDGEEEFTFMPESYIANESMGEEEYSFWVNEAWEGTKIGDEIYVNIRPRVVLYNRLSNPSRCHFGIIGSVYNLNNDKPFSMVDMMKPFSYLYDIIHDRLNKMMAKNWGMMTRLDLSKKPAYWDMDKWMYYAKTMGLFVEDSFNEGLAGAATGKLAGGLNSNTQGTINADFGNNIQQYINLLEYIKQEMADVAGISKQREGNIANRETVGGVERATLQSSYITEWIFAIHDDVKKRVYEAFLETAKAALRGRNKKFLYILSDNSLKVLDVDGDEFAECDYGLIVENSSSVQLTSLKIEGLALAALQSNALSFSTIMKLYSTASLAEKQRFVENDETKMREMQQQQQLEALQQQQQQLQMQMQAHQEELQFKQQLNNNDNQTRLRVAEINSEAELAILQLKNSVTKQDMLELRVDEQIKTKEKLMQEMEMLDKKLLLERDRIESQDKLFDRDLEFQKQKQNENLDFKRLLLLEKIKSDNAKRNSK